MYFQILKHWAFLRCIANKGNSGCRIWLFICLFTITCFHFNIPLFASILLQLIRMRVFFLIEFYIKVIRIRGKKTNILCSKIILLRTFTWKLVYWLKTNIIITEVFRLYIKLIMFALRFQHEISTKYNFKHFIKIKKSNTFYLRQF